MSRDPLAGMLEGPLAREVLRLGAPLALAMVLQVLFNLVDQYVIARLPAGLSDPSLDALGMCDMVGALATIASYGVSSATATLVAQARGRGDDGEVARLAWGSVGLVVALGLAFGLVGAVGADAIVHGLLGAKGLVRDLARDYLRVNVGGIVTVFVMFQVTAVQRALGHGRATLAVFVTGNALNLLLAVLLVYGPGEAPAAFAWGPPLARALHLPRWELAGAAWATILARLVACALALALLARQLPGFRPALLLPPPATRRRLLRLAGPTSAQLSLRIGSVLVVVALVHHYFTTAADSDAGTAYALTLRLETLATFVSMGWGGAAQTLVGTCVGAALLARARRAGWIAAAYAAATMLGLAALFRLGGEAFLRFFTRREPVIALAMGYVRLVSPSYVAFGLGSVLSNALVGAGRARVGLALDLVLVALVQAPLMLVVCGPLRAPPAGLWTTLVAMNLLGAAAYALAWHRRGPA